MTVYSLLSNDSSINDERDSCDFVKSQMFLGFTKYMEENINIINKKILYHKSIDIDLVLSSVFLFCHNISLT